jgi:hypothetical protein
MPDLADGEAVEMKGSGAKPYVLKNVGGVYSCTCPAWRNQSVAIERRSCKHLRKLRGDAAEELRIGQDLPPRPDAEAGEEGSAGVPLLLAHANSAPRHRRVRNPSYPTRMAKGSKESAQALAADKCRLVCGGI